MIVKDHLLPQKLTFKTIFHKSYLCVTNIHIIATIYKEVWEPILMAKYCSEQGKAAIEAFW